MYKKHREYKKPSMMCSLRHTLLLMVIYKLKAMFSYIFGLRSDALIKIMYIGDPSKTKSRVKVLLGPVPAYIRKIVVKFSGFARLYFWYEKGLYEIKD